MGVRRRRGKSRRSGGLAAAWVAGAVVLAALVLGAARAEDETPIARPTEVRFGRDVRPILADRCFTCHGPDAGARRAELRLDERESALRVIVPGSPEKSELWRRVSSGDPDDVMPPPESPKPRLSPAEREVVRRWIEAGAVYEAHWAFEAPTRPELPRVREGEWARNEIDVFILSGLERAGLKPSSEADRETLCRRVFLDLTGLPPTPEEIDEFLADVAPGAYERLVDRLLTVEPYLTRHAERFAAPWLDQARYADTSGIHIDAGRQMWLWRDWVLNAYRENMPFDRFVVEQLAGDLLPGTTDAEKIASGFNRNHVTSDEGGAINEEYLVEYAAERTATTGSVFLGLTLNCARCHDHKFDPISQEDYFGLFAFFNSIDEPGVYSQESDANRAFEPFITVFTAAQRERRAELGALLESLREELGRETEEDIAARARFREELGAIAGPAWAEASVSSARSTGGATLTVLDDGSVLASGENPAKDEHEIEIETAATGLRFIALEALTDTSLANGRVGRAPNGNAVLTSFEAEAVSTADPSRREPIEIAWAWADVEQANGDFRVLSALGGGEDRGWAVRSHEIAGPRLALFLSSRPFGFEGGTRIRFRLGYQSRYERHALGRVRFSVGAFGDEGAARLGAAAGSWYVVGPFTPGEGRSAFEQEFGPERASGLDFAQNFGEGNQYWRYEARMIDGTPFTGLAAGVNASYLGRRIYAPTARVLNISLGSDDGFRLFVNGSEVAGRNVSRGVAPDQDRATVELRPGENTIVLKIVNTGGPGGAYWRADEEGSLLRGDVLLALTPPGARSEAREAAFSAAWRSAFSDGYRALAAKVGESEAELSAIERAAPRAMVMKELAQPRPVFVLERGEYDKPDKSRPVSRGVPAALGFMAEDLPRDRLGLARWIVSPENPLTARVAVNRAWELLFGEGLVRTTEDFGFQGEWPSHPELLDYLAVEFREGGWDYRGLLRQVVTSATYRQSSRVREDAAEVDPENRLLSHFPRRRLSAEQIRDQALFVSGLLVEKAGGPSVKPYQPEGLWQEVSMPQSNTRVYVRGEGEDLWRRSIYTYWKRASPPPSLLIFDAPTRESCTIRRISTDTPLQALALWNDEQFVEAARVLAERTLLEAGDDGERLSRLFRRCTGRRPTANEAKELADALEHFRGRYAGAPGDAAALGEVGAATQRAMDDVPELAAWMVVAGGVLSLDATIARN